MACFFNCEKLKSLDISSFNFSKLTETNYMFDECTSLTNLKFGKNLQQTIKLTDCPLTHKSVLSVINGLAEADKQRILWLNSNTYKTLSEEDIKLVTDKNWKIMTDDDLRKELDMLTNMIIDTSNNKL